MEIFDEANRVESHNPDILNMLAYSQRKSGMLDQSIANYKRALALRHHFPEADEYLGEAYIQAALAQIQTLLDHGEMGEKHVEKLKGSFLEAVKSIKKMKKKE
jgi:tetratricopeptide (TPR) repeat protein